MKPCDSHAAGRREAPRPSGLQGEARRGRGAAAGGDAVPPLRDSPSAFNDLVISDASQARGQPEDRTQRTNKRPLHPRAAGCRHRGDSDAVQTQGPDTRVEESVPAPPTTSRSPSRRACRPTRPRRPPRRRAPRVPSSSAAPSRATSCPPLPAARAVHGRAGALLPVSAPQRLPAVHPRRLGLLAPREHRRPSSTRAPTGA